MSNAQRDEANKRLLMQIITINLVVLEKTLQCCKAQGGGYACALDRMIRIRDRMEQAAIEVGKVL